MKTIIPFLIVSLFPVGALACAVNETPVFSCTTTTGRAVQVCQAPDQIRYAFGRPNAPEMKVSVPNQTFVWNGDGGSAMHTFDLHFDNTGTRYTVSIVRFREDSELSADIQVRQGDRRVAKLACKAPSIRFEERAIKAKRTPY